MGDEPRRAKSALAAVMGDHRLLHRVQRAVWGFHAFDCPNGFALKLWHEQDTGIQSARAVGICHHDRTGPAVAFVAAFFGAGQLPVLAKPIQKCCRGRCVGSDISSVQKKSGAHGRNLPRYRSPLTLRGLDAT